MAAIAAHQPPADEEPWQENLSNHIICPDCKEDPPNLIEEYSSGDMVCGDCGLVVGARIVDMSSEWRTFSNDDQNNDDPSRVGDAPNMLLNGDQLSTEVAMGDTKMAKDLRRAQGRNVNDKNNKNLVNAYRHIDSVCGTMNTGSIISNYVKVLYKELTDAPRNPLKLKPLDVIVAGLIFVACRELKVARSFREVHQMTAVSKKEIGKVFKALFDWRSAGVAKNGAPARPDLSESQSSGKIDNSLVIRSNSRLGLSRDVGGRIEQLVKQVDQDGTLAGRSPLSVVGAVIWFIINLMDEKKSLSEVSKVVGVSDSTIKTSYRTLYEEKDRLIKPEWLKDGRSKLSNLGTP